MIVNNSDIFSISNKVILITGGYGYLGKYITNGLAACNAKVIVLGLNKEKFDAAFEDSPSKENIYFQQFDILDTDSIQKGLKQVKDQFGPIDVIINNAFASASLSPADVEWKYNIDGMLSSVNNCLFNIVPYFRENGGGRIINVSSMYGIVAPDFKVYKGIEEYTSASYYGAAKAGVIQLTRYYASLLGRENILVNCVSPGPFPSTSVQENKEFIRRLSERTLLERIGQPEELPGIFIFLCSSASSYVTGQNFVIDGGWTAV